MASHLMDNPTYQGIVGTTAKRACKRGVMSTLQAAGIMEFGPGEFYASCAEGAERYIDGLRVKYNGVVPPFLAEDILLIITPNTVTSRQWFYLTAWHRNYMSGLELNLSPYSVHERLRKNEKLREAEQLINEHVAMHFYPDAKELAKGILEPEKVGLVYRMAYAKELSAPEKEEAWAFLEGFECDECFSRILSQLHRTAFIS